jgi:plastocyanin
MRSRMGWGALLAVALAACGGGSSNGGESTTPAGTPGGTPAANPPSSSNVITIQGMAFSPLRLEVTPGATVTVRNLDAEVHSVTSQSTRGAFRPGAANGVSFDTGIFTGERTFTIPSNAQVGTTVPYFCSSHLQTMVTPNGEIAIVASSTGSGGTPSTPSTPSQPTSPYANE